MNRDFLSPLHWLIYCLTPPGHLFTHRRCSTTDYKALRHLESQFCHEGMLTCWPFILDQTTNRRFLSPLQCVLPDSNWPRFHLRKTLYHGKQGPSTLGKAVLPRTAVSILTISTDQAKFCTYSMYILLLLVYSAF